MKNTYYGMEEEFVNACRDGNISKVKTLLTMVDPSYNHNKAILLASVEGDVEIVRLLLTDPRVDPSAGVNQTLRWASAQGHVDVVRLLLTDSRVDPTAYDNEAIRWAKRGDCTEVVNLLTEHIYRLDGPIYNEGIL